MPHPSLPDHSRKTGIALEKTYQFLLWLIPTVEKFPKSQRFLLGDYIQSTELAQGQVLFLAFHTGACHYVLPLSRSPESTWASHFGDRYDR